MKVHGESAEFANVSGGLSLTLLAEGHLDRSLWSRLSPESGLPRRLKRGQARTGDSRTGQHSQNAETVRRLNRIVFHARSGHSKGVSKGIPL
jgi:hypothetical protein